MCVTCLTLQAFSKYSGNNREILKKNGDRPHYITVFSPSSIFCLWQGFVGVIGFPRRWHKIPIIFLLTLLDLLAILHLFWATFCHVLYFLLTLCVVSFLFTFPHLLGRPSFLYNFAIAHFEFFIEILSCRWLTLQSLFITASQNYLRILDVSSSLFHVTLLFLLRL